MTNYGVKEIRFDTQKKEFEICDNCTLPDCFDKSPKCLLNGERNKRAYSISKERQKSYSRKYYADHTHEIKVSRYQHQTAREKVLANVWAKPRSKETS